MEKLFVTRTDTLVGATAAAVLGDRFEVVVAADSSAATWCDQIRRERPQFVLHAGAAAWSSWDLAGVDGVRAPATSDLSREPSLVGEVGAACRDVAARWAIVASDSVFRGPRMFHDEEGPSWSTTATARSLRAVEAAALSAGAAVFRSHVYGWLPEGGATNYAERMLHSLTAELPCKVDARRQATPILATDFAGLLADALCAGVTGLFNLTGAERTTPHRFAAELAATLGVPGRNVRLAETDERLEVRRLDETSLNVGKIRRRLNLPLPMLREGLSRFVDQAFNGYRDRLRTKPATPSEAQRAREFQAA